MTFYELFRDLINLMLEKLITILVNGTQTIVLLDMMWTIGHVNLMRGILTLVQLKICLKHFAKEEGYQISSSS